MNRSFILFVMLSVILTACGASISDPPPTEYAWCYEFDFTGAIDYSENIIDGSRTANGLESVDGVINASIIHNLVVEPIYVRAFTQIIVEDSTNLSANFDVFGIAQQINTPVEQSDYVTLSAQPDGNTTFSNRLLLSFATDENTTAIVRGIQVYGNGSNPFGSSSPCDDFSTPEPNTNLGLNCWGDSTYAISGCPDGYDPTWSAWTFVSGNIDGTGIVRPQTYDGVMQSRLEMVAYCDGEYFVSVRTTGISTTDHVRGYVNGSLKGNYDRGNDATNAYLGDFVVGDVIEIRHQNNSDNELRVAKIVCNANETPQAPQPTPTATAGVSPTPLPFNFVWCYQFNFRAAPSGWRLADTLHVNGEQNSGVWQDSIGYMPTNGSVAIEINIPEPIPYRLINFVQGIGTDLIALYDVDNPFSDLSDPFAFGSTTINYNGTTQARSIWVQSSQTITGLRLSGSGINNPFGSNNCDQPLAGLATVTPIPSLTPVATSTFAPTNTPEPQPTFEPTATPDPADDLNSFSPDGTCANYGGSEPTGSNVFAPFEWLFGGLVNFYNCVLLPPINFTATKVSELVTAVRDTFTFLTTFVRDSFNSLGQNVRNLLGLLTTLVSIQFQTLLANALTMINTLKAMAATMLGISSFLFDWSIWVVTSLIPYFIGWLQNFWRMLTYYFLELLLNGVSFLVGVYLLITDLMNIARSFAGNIIDFILTGIVFASTFLSMWNNATPQPIPGLPDCLNAPLEHNICAVWYILEHTLFAGVGSFFIPAITVFVSIMVVLYFLETVVERMQKVWEIFRR